MKPKINKTSEYFEIIGHYDDSVLCAKLTLLADLYAIEHREGYAKFRIEDEDKLELVNEKLDYLGQLYIYSNNGQTLLTHLDYGPFTSLTCTITSTGTNEDDMGQNYTYSGSQTFLGFSITANATVPDSDLEVGDSFRLDSNKTVYIVEGSSSSTVTDLTGTKWYFNTNPDVSMAIVGPLELYFTSNNTNYVSIRYGKDGPESFITYSTGTSTTLAYQVTTWEDEAYRTIEITGGTDATNSDLIAWLQANATQIIEPEITDLTGTKWLLNSSLDLSIQTAYELNFVSNDTNYIYFAIAKSPNPKEPIDYSLAYYTTYYNGRTVYSAYGGDWIDEVYRTIQITGGTDATNSGLITWLQANATQVQIGPTYTLSTTLNNCTITNLSFTLAPNSGYKLPSSISVTNATLVSYNSTSGKVVLSGVSDSSSVDVEFSAVQLISFKVSNKTYQAEGGMTWEQWCDSTYNTDNFYISDNKVCPSNGTLIADVLPTDAIIADCTYTYYYEITD